ncbi:MAG: NERD domain-containing protein [Lawsonibacter sp.]|nr:NERD domain-containing protein [Lawsonibacter sp.]
MDFITNLTQGQVLLICLLAFLCTLAFPRLLRNKRQAKQEFLYRRLGRLPVPKQEKKQKDPYTHNGGRGEIEALLVKLKPYAKLNGMRIVFPGTVKYNGRTAQSTMLLVGRFGVLAIRCCGFGGRITADGGEEGWTQWMNQKTRRLKDPLQVMEEDCTQIRSALEALHFGPVQVLGATVFTRRDVILDTPMDCGVYKQGEFLEWLYQSKALLEDNGLDVTLATQSLVDLVRKPKAD